MKLVIANGHMPGVPEILALLAHPPSSNPESLAAVSGIGGSLASLVTHIVDRHHARTRHELRRLAALG
jgi:iron-sulfur cluster repair protein YtfE (RIC family)